MADTKPNFSDPTGLSQGLAEATAQLKITSEKFSVAFLNMEGGALALNKQFGQGRQRITELKLAVADATPVVDRLGGTLSDAVETTREISEATRRNVVASTEDISKLYAAGQILGKGVKEIVENFQDVGVQFSQIGTQLEDSIDYIQSVGVNAGQVMGKVMENMSQMNRFNFQDGVQGLTRMATQATLLKFDMGQVFTLADKAMDPQGAIELSSAFQRLGLAAGGLTDPFELMYKSLNDPEGLQDSLVEMTKQFTFFDEKTKSFKINPAGMLQLRELQAQTGINAAEMSKLALNTADLDRKLSMLKPSLKFENEEDKMYLANIAKMDKSGEYTVKYVDDAGQEHQEKLENLTQDQLDFLIQQEKDKPKDLEEIQRSQLFNIEIISGDLRAVRDKVVYGTISAPKVSLLAEDLGTITKIATDSLNNSVSQKNVRSTVDNSIGDIKNIIAKMAKGEKTDFDFEKLMEKTKGAFDIDKLKEKVTAQVGQIKDKIPQKVKNRYDLGNVDLSKMMEKMYNWFDTRGNKEYPTEDFPAYYKPSNGGIPYNTESFPQYDKKKGKGINYPTEEFPSYDFSGKKGLSVTKIDADSINVGDKGLAELLQSMASKQNAMTPNNGDFSVKKIDLGEKGLSVTKIDADSINVGDKGLAELLQSMVSKQNTMTPNNGDFSVKKIDTATINVGDKGLTELFQSVANKQISVTPESIAKPVSNVPQQQLPTTQTPYDVNATHKHVFEGSITWKIDAPPELDTKRFYAMIEKQEFKNTFTKIVIDKFKETEQTSLSQYA